MLLRDYCRDRGRIAELARRVGCDHTAISRLVRDGEHQRKASLKFALRIELATGGEVMAHEVPLSEASRMALAAMRSVPVGPDTAA